MATAKQLAARKLFAARAKAGTLRGKPAAKKTVRKNPAVKKAATKTVRKNPARTTTILGSREKALPYAVQVKTKQSDKWNEICRAAQESNAVQIAKALSDIHSNLFFRVTSD